MAYQVNSLDYGDYRYTVGDTIVISSGAEYLYGDIGATTTVSTPGISQDVRKISQLWVQDATGSVVRNPVFTSYHTGPMRYGGGFIRFEQIASGGLKIKHYVTFNANGGSGAPGTQTKVWGSILTLSTARPTREGYNFIGWNTRPDGTGTGYAPGQQYGDDNDLSLYASWAIVTYTVSYNANGGSGAPGNQYKSYGSALTLTSAAPSRTGYTFKGWATSSGGDPTYSPGSLYNNNASITLYAVWQAVTYTVSYNANGGSGAPVAQEKTYGVTLTLSPTRPTRTNYNFLGWGISSGSTSVSYSPGGQYTSNASITLYAVWQLAYQAPRLSNLSASRSNSSGTLIDDGTYAKVSFNWSTDRTVSQIKIDWGTSSYTSSATVSASGTSGTVGQVIGGGALNVENVYNIRVTVSDSGGSTVLTTSIPTMKFDIDIISGGGGVAIGKVAQSKNLFDVGYAAKFQSTLTIGNINVGNSISSINSSINSINSSISTINNNLAQKLGLTGGNLTGSLDVNVSAGVQHIGFYDSSDSNHHIYFYSNAAKTGKSDHMGIQHKTKGNIWAYSGDHKMFHNVRNVFNQSLNLPYNQKIFFGDNGRIYSTSGQHLYFAGSAEADYFLHLGVHDSRWTLDPDVDNRLALGSPNHRYTNIFAVDPTVYSSD